MADNISKIKELITYISPNMLKTFDICPAKFYYRYIEQIPAPVLDKNFSAGKNIHALASYYLKNADIKKFENALTGTELPFWEYLKTNKYLGYEPVGVEKNIITKINDFWLGGRLDAIVKENNDYFILDYKTGGVDGDMLYDYQTMIYLIAFDSYISDYENLNFVYIDLKNKNETEINFTQELKESYSKLLSQKCESVLNFDISKFKKAEQCKCEYSKICEI